MLVNLKAAIDEKYKGSYTDAAEVMYPGKKNGVSTLSHLVNSDPETPKRRPTYEALKKGFSEYNIDWLLGKSTFKLSTKNKPSAENTIRPSVHENGVDYNAKIIGQVDLDKEYLDEDGNNKFYYLGEGSYRMKLHIVNESAKAGYLTGFADPEFVEDLPFIYTTVDIYHKGRYLAFKVEGDSMDVDARRTFVHGDTVIGREIKRELWKSRFHTHKYPFYVFVTKTEGIILKEIIKHDVENGIVTLHSLNPDKDMYPDFELHLDDVHQIFNVVKREESI